MSDATKIGSVVFPFGGGSGPPGPSTTGALLNVQRIVVSGNYVVPAGVTSIVVEAIGGGAGGMGYASAGNESGAGNGGGSGAYVCARMPVVPGDVYTAVIGAGGGGGPGPGGAGNGTQTSFIGNGQTILAAGGLASNSVMGAIANTEATVGGQGGVIASAVIGELAAVSGEPGADALRIITPGFPGSPRVLLRGKGGSTPYGRGVGGGYPPVSQDGLFGQGFGAGGGGGILYEVPIGNSISGGQGAAGILIVWEYS